MNYLASLQFYMVVYLLVWLWPTLGFGDALLPYTHYKYRVVQSVCERIATAKGDVRRMPSVEVYSRASGSRKIAYFKPQPQPMLYVDEQLYDVCQRFGRDSLNALACIIGHELAHYYENHSLANSFANLTNPTTPPASPNQQTEQVRLEAEADYFGLFYSFLAGYDTYRILPHVLDAIYQQYNLPEQLSGYPTRKARIQMAQEKVREIMPLVSTFQAGQLLYLRKNYDEAAVCFDYLLTKFPSREVYNNAGVAKLAQAIQFLDAEQLYFAYPFELDARTRLKQGTPHRGEDKKERYRKADDLLSAAQRNFENAITVDPSYTPGYVNLACAYSLRGNQELAIGTVNELKKLSDQWNTSLPANASLLRGIALVKNDQIEKARADFESAEKKSAYCAQYNMALYKKLASSWQDQLEDWLTNWPAVDGWIRKYWGEQKENTKLAPEKGLEGSTRVSAGENKAESTLVIANPNYPVKIVNSQSQQIQKLRISLRDYQLLWFTTEPNYLGRTALGIGIGTRLIEVVKRYGEPDYKAGGAASEQYYCYQQVRLIFRIADGRVKGWSTYQIAY